jgi:haloalkane dehalogenase/tRNA(adenine34) deaminase
MESFRTPDDCFANLPDFPFAPSYRDDLAGFEGLRMHFVDAGPRDATAVWLCLHGQPTWSFLYRKMIPVFAAAGDRVIAPDLFGFGRSDKPTADATYTFDFHRESLLALIERLDLRNIRLVCQDWGGLLGLTLPMSQPSRFTALLAMNTTLGTGDVKLGEGFLSWRNYVRNTPDFDITALMRRSEPDMSMDVAAAYAAPFPNPRYRAGVRRFPDLVPEFPDSPGAALSRQARDWWRTEWRGRSLMGIGMRDPVLGPPVMRALREIIRDCPPAIEIPEAGHFVQERGAELAAQAVKAFAG